MPWADMSQAFGLNAHGSASQREFFSRETAEDVGNPKLSRGAATEMTRREWRHSAEVPLQEVL